MAHSFRRLGLAFSTLAGLAALIGSGCDQMAPPPPEPSVAVRSAALTEAVCTATGGHERHAVFGCATCHAMGGALCFDPAGPAYFPGAPAPSFDPVAKTCSSVACHGMYSGTFAYYRWDWGCECQEEMNVPYAGNGGSTPSWYATDARCFACHGNPPPAFVAWHGQHANGTFAGSNDCQLCHPDALAQANTGIGYALNTANTCTVNGVPNSSCALLHANGTVDVQPRWASRCIGCH